MKHFYSGTYETTFYKAQRVVLKAKYPALETTISKLKMSHDRSNEIRTAYANTIEEKNTHRPERKVSEVINEISKLSRDNKATRKYNLLSALALATGARPNEIIMHSEFKQLPENRFKQIGISREKAGQSHIDEVTRPAVGLSSNQIIALIHEYRTMWSDYITKKRDAGKSDTEIVRLILLATNKHTGSVLGLDKTMSYFRKVYANTAEAIRTDKNMERMMYIGRILGHSPGDSTTAHSYSIIRIIDDR